MINYHDLFIYNKDNKEDDIIDESNNLIYFCRYILLTANYIVIIIRI